MKGEWSEVRVAVQMSIANGALHRSRPLLQRALIDCGLTAGRAVRTLGFVLIHRIRPVSPPLAPHVEHLWIARGYLPVRWGNMILPDGAMELMVNLGDPQKLCEGNDQARHTVFRHSGSRANGRRRSLSMKLVTSISSASGCEPAARGRFLEFR